jgi:hypothetical protein
MAHSPPATPTLIGLPYDASSSFRRGTAAAPPSIRQALHSPAGNPWTETGVDLSRDGALGDMGDVPLGAAAADVRVQIEEAVRTLLESGARPIALGGDHSVSYPIVPRSAGGTRSSPSCTSTPTPTCTPSFRAIATPTPAHSPGSWRSGSPIASCRWESAR